MLRHETCDKAHGEDDESGEEKHVNLK